MSLLSTDGYLFSTQEAGFPLRSETFTYTHRKGGWQLLPFDPAQYVQDLLDKLEPTEEDYAYLAQHGYLQGAAFRAAMLAKGHVCVTGLEKGSWFYEREPVFSVHGPSALVAWLEPQVLRAWFPIQVATAAALGRPTPAAYTCNEESDIAEDTIVQVGGVLKRHPHITCSLYQAAIRARACELVKVVEDPARLFEVGMRATTCEMQHTLALSALRDAGITRTSNVGAARDRGMIPVGTMNHNHVQRHGGSYAAFCALRDRYPGFVFYLPDTFSTLYEGLPAAVRAMQDVPTRLAGFRFDAEAQVAEHYFTAVATFRRHGLAPRLALEGGWNLAKTIQFEKYAEAIGWPRELQAYGLGDYLVRPPWDAFRRDDVQAVYKLSQTGRRAVMKHGDEPGAGKASIPGCPRVYRAPLGSGNYRGPCSIIAQDGETLPAEYRDFNGRPLDPRHDFDPAMTIPPVLSPATADLVRRCTAERAALLHAESVT